MGERMSRNEQEVIQLCGDVEVIASADGAKGPRAFAVKAYTGGELRVPKYDLPIIVDLDGMTMAKSIVANLHHKTENLVGHATEVVKEGGQLSLRGSVSATGASAQEFTANHDNGFPWQASIEAKPTKVVEIQAGKSVTVNGREFVGPVLVARKSKLFGVAFVPRGADENTSVTIAASAADSWKGNLMKFTEWVEAMGLVVDELSEKQTAALQTRFDAEIKAAAKDDDKHAIIASPEFDLDDIKAAALEFTASLEAIQAEHEFEVNDKKKLAEIKAGAFKSARDLKATALKERWPTAKYEVESIKAASKFELELVKAKAPVGPAIHSRSHDSSPAVIEAALCMSLGMPNVEKEYDEKTLDTAHRQYRNIGLQQFLILAAAENGYQFRPGEHVHQGNLRSVLAHALPDIKADGASTEGLSSTILSNIANKELLIGYMQEDQSWGQICARKSVRDFKLVTSYRMLDNMEYEQLGPNGEIKHGTVGVESYTRQANTYAKMFALTRTDIINDDLGAFDDLRTRIGLGAAKKFSTLFWTTFLNNSTFFTAARGNYITGATTTLLTDGVGLELALLSFRKLTSPAADGSKKLGTVIGGRPEILLVPPELEFNSERLYQSTNVVAAGGSSGATVPNQNIHGNKYRPVVCPWLSDTNIANNSSTAWYLLRAPTVYPAIVASFLNGQESPTVESALADFDSLGVQFRGYHDFGVDLAEYVSWIKSKGAA